MKSKLQNHNSRWSSTEIATLKSMVLAGKNSSQIAKALGRTRASVMGKKASMNWGSAARIVRGKNTTHGDAPMTIGTKKRSTKSVGTQATMDFDKHIQESKKQLKAEKIKAIAKVAKAKVESTKSTKDIGTLVSQLKSFAKESGLKMKITFEN